MKHILKDCPLCYEQMINKKEGYPVFGCIKCGLTFVLIEERMRYPDDSEVGPIQNGSFFIKYKVIQEGV